MNPTQILDIWRRLSAWPGGKWLFSKLIGWMAPYTGTVGARIEELRPGYARVHIRDRRGVRNHLKSVHAIALMNVGEVATGLAMYTGLPKGGRGIIVELGMTYSRKARGTITAVAECSFPQESGKHDIRIEAPLVDAEGKEVARARAVWRVEIP